MKNHMRRIPARSFALGRRPSALSAAMVMAATCAAGGQPVEIRIDCGTESGAGAHADLFGHAWQPDRAYETSSKPRSGYIGGETETCINPGLYGGAIDGALYRTTRTGFSEYRFDVPDGFYSVRLRFVEKCEHGPGFRVFDIEMEGIPVRTGFDIAAEVGKDYALDYTFPAAVTDGVLNVTVTPVMGSPTIAAIAVVSAEPDAAAPFAPGGLTARGGFEQNILVWNPGVEVDRAGCHVYRAASPGGPFERIDSGIVATHRHIDRSAAVGSEMFYQVRAVDIWGNEGAATDTVSATAVAAYDTPLPIYDLSIDGSALSTLYYDVNAETTVETTLTYGGEVFDGVAARFIDVLPLNVSKKGWHFAFGAGHPLLNRTSVRLHPMYSDFFLLRNALGLGMFEAVGADAPAGSYAHLEVNDEFWGVFLDVEEVNDDFLARRGLDTGGNLYEAIAGRLSTFPAPGDYAAAYRKINNLESSYGDLIHLIESTNNVEDDAFGPAMHQLVNVRQVLDYYAATILIGNTAFSADNYYLYHDPAADRWMIYPKDASNTFGIGTILGGDGWATPINLGVEGVLPEHVFASNVVITRLMAVDAFRDHVADRLEEWIATIFNSTIMGPAIDVVFNHIKEDVYRDVRKLGWEKNDLFNAGPGVMKQFVALRGPFLLNEIPGFAPRTGPYASVNEVMAVNDGGVLDEFGESEPWIEIYHAGAGELELGGMYLTSDVDMPLQWRIPAGLTIGAGGHVLFWADGSTAQGATHAAITLNAGGGTVALFASDGTTLIDVFEYGPQAPGASTGRYPDGKGAPTVLTGPSPGDWNYVLNAAPAIFNTRHAPRYPTEDDEVVVTCQVQDDRGIEAVSLIVDVGLSPDAIKMFDDGAHGDGGAGDGMYGATIPAAPDGLEVRYFVLAIDDQSAESRDPASAPAQQHSYVVGFVPEETYTPAEGALLSAAHVLFGFDPIAGAAEYDLEVHADDFEDEPSGDGPVVAARMSRPRRIVTEGLEFGRGYAWRVRPIDAEGAAGEWSSWRRFSIVTIDSNLQNRIAVTIPLPGRMQAGVTLFNAWAIPGASSLSFDYILAIDGSGRLVYVMPTDPLGAFVSGDVRLLRNGHLLVGKPVEAYEMTLDGTIVRTTDGMELFVDSHEIFDMPNGNWMFLIDEVQTVMRNGAPQPWAGHRIVELNAAGDIVWDWNTFDHLSTLDFDECSMEFPRPSGNYDWIHGNGVVYDAIERAVYLSSRHLSRITRIDYDTGGVDWHMGLPKPSDEVDFPVDLFSFQHSPQILENGNILLYDNGNRRGDTYCETADPYSAAVELKVDPQSATPVTVQWEHRQNLYSATKGDADRLRNGNTLITGGHAGAAVIQEVSPAGELVWEMRLPFPSSMYRAERVASLYPMRGDVDGDDDLDLVDFGDMQRCFRGADGFAVHRNCLIHDRDEDGDVDAGDFAGFAQSVTGDGP